MSPERTVDLLGLLILFIFTYSSNAQTNISAELGQDVILPCKVPNKYNINNITAVEWIRPDQDPEYVLFYRDGHLDPDNQHPSYQNRVDLQDRKMKDGVISLDLNNVTMEDNGTYECRVSQGRKKDLISIIDLEVHLPGDQDGNTGDGGNKDAVLVVLCPPLVTAMIFMVVIGHVVSVIYRERR